VEARPAQANAEWRVPISTYSGRRGGDVTDSGSPVTWLDEEHLRCGQANLLAVFDGRSEALESTPEQFILVKSRHMIDWYERQFAQDPPRRVLEVGIFKGGSVALFAGLWQPEQLLAVDIVTEPVAALDEFVRASGLGDRVKARYGVDQADAETLRALITEEFAGEPLDLVIDDGCHFFAETKATFEAVFPLLRPGGTYVIEDWAWAHWPGVWQVDGGPWAEKPSVTLLALELAMLSASRPDLVESVEITTEFIIVRKGPSQTMESGFSLASGYVTAGRTFVEEGYAPGGGTATAVGAQWQLRDTPEARLAQTQSELAERDIALKAATDRTLQLTTDLAEQERLVRSMERSLSWRLTAPLRWLKAALRR
jgi:SAM-dependent methyltransferase